MPETSSLFAERNVRSLGVLNLIRSEVLDDAHKMGFRQHFETTILLMMMVVISGAEMEYCASAASMLAEEIWQNAEGFVEVPAYLWAQLKKCSK